MNELSLLEGLVSGFEGEVEAGRKVIAHQARALRIACEKLMDAYEMTRDCCLNCAAFKACKIQSELDDIDKSDECIKTLIDYVMAATKDAKEAGDAR